MAHSCDDSHAGRGALERLRDGPGCAAAQHFIADRIDFRSEALGQLCRTYGAKKLALFGSMRRPDYDTERSDVDLVVEFAPVSDRSPARQYFEFKKALEALFGKPVDLVELSAMPDCRLRRIIERTQLLVYIEA
jgi:uncharacterized protein